MACTQLATSGDCTPTTNMQTSPVTINDGWRYGVTDDVYYIDSDVSGRGFPAQAYRSCYQPTGGAIQCFTFTPTNTSTPVSTNLSCSWGATYGPCDPGVCSTSTI